jgi:hypothetical protein
MGARLMRVALVVWGVLMVLAVVWMAITAKKRARDPRMHQ